MKRKCVWVTFGSKGKNTMTTTSKTKRANGSGSLRWVESRQQYEHRVTIGRTPDGKLLSASFYGNTQKEALSKSSNRTKIVSLDGLSTNPTVKEWFDYWTNEICVNDGTKETTRIHKLRIAKTYVLPYIGELKLVALRANHVRTMLNGISKQGKSSQTQSHALKLTRQFLKMAVRHELITKNYASPEFVDGIKRTKTRHVRAMNQKEAETLLRYTDEHASLSMKTLTYLLIYGGMRKGEALALSWRDIDFKNGEVRIGRNLTRVPLTNRQGLVMADDVGIYRSKLCLGQPKTDESSRTITISPTVLTLLKTLKETQSEQRYEFEYENGIPFGGEWANENLVFTTDTGTPFDPNNFQHRFSKLAKQAELGNWTVHEMRHTCASLLINNGMSLYDVSKYLGHSSVEITGDLYGHWASEGKQRIADAMTEILG